MSEGFRRAGLPVTMAFDRDPDACASYAHNLGHSPIQMDVHGPLGSCCLRWTPGAIDLLVADPPCTPWSRAGSRRGLDDERDCLLVTRDLILVWRPRAYLIGNVPGLDDAPNLPIVREATRTAARRGLLRRRLPPTQRRRLRRTAEAHPAVLVWPSGRPVSHLAHADALRSGPSAHGRPCSPDSRRGRPWPMRCESCPSQSGASPPSLNLRRDRHPASRANPTRPDRHRETALQRWLGPGMAMESARHDRTVRGAPERTGQAYDRLSD